VESLCEEIEGRIEVKYDVAIIGSGVGGYPAGSYLAGKGLKVAVIEKHLIGGECTNYGCVPSKALYQFAEAVKTIEKINGVIEYKWSELIEWAKGVVKESREGISYLLESKGVDLYNGVALIESNKRVKIKDSAELKEIEADKLIVATGTDPADIPVARFDGSGIISNREALYLDHKPESMLIIGGGVVGVELANAFSAFKVDVTIVELLDHILPFTDRDIALAVKTHLSQRGVRILEKTTVSRLEKAGGKYHAELSNGEKLEVDKVLVAVGRKPNTRGIGLENLGVELDYKGFIKVSERMETSAQGVFATGDVVGGPLLAHKAILESIIAGRVISGEEAPRLDYKLVPITIFTGLEVASVGYTEKELQSMGLKYVKYRIPLYYLSSVKIKGGKNAFAKIILDERGERVLGIHIVAPNASEVVSAYIPLYIGKMNLKDAAQVPYPHLTVSESLRDFAEYILGEPVHLLKK
jgi:dihydrolipoamide dehydrogenase